MLFKEIKILLAVVLGLFIVVLGTKQLLAHTEKRLGPDFITLLHTNPRTDELNKAFAMYEKETGKDKNQMTYAEVNTYVLKVRDDLGGGWTQKSLDDAMKSLRRGR